MNSSFLIRIRFVLVSLSLFAVVIVFRLYIIQIARGETYIKTADAQYVKSSRPVFDRGSIYFESKAGTRVSVATVKNGYTLIMNPKLLTNPENVYIALSQYIEIPKDVFMQKAQKKNDQYEELAKKIDGSVGESINALKIPGIYVYKNNVRFYPGGPLASQTIGIVGYDEENNQRGRYGLERYYQDVLDRTSNNKNVNFFAELFAGKERGVFQSSQERGDIVTSIDPTVENYLEKTLLDTQKLWKSDFIGGIIMDPKTGQIYAMTSLPSFDPNDLSSVKDPRIFSNNLVENVYEMGSIIKPLTILAGIDSGKITRKTTYNDEGFLNLNGKKINNFDLRGRGVVSMQEVLNQSLNTGAATVALKLGNEEFKRYFTSFGLAEKTGIDQPNEQKGLVKNLNSTRDIEIATASYGQGIAMTPIATVRALSILANDGRLIRPHLIKEIDYLNGSVEKIKPDIGIQVVQKESTDEVTRMLVEVVDSYIAKAHPGIRMEHYSIAAKTGTAQIADPARGGYYDDRYVHSFFGYFPAYNPRFIVFLYHYYPKGAKYSSETLANPFIDLAKFLINYYEIPPDR